ncbi:cytochrome c [Thioclava sp. 15-R06ZXC-3]|uniref:Cytochrome c n=1 Tax=Thioclava arctica TaxID=3238301 RepID=A0ABV3TRP4_9RHOB
MKLKSILYCGGFIGALATLPLAPARAQGMMGGGHGMMAGGRTMGMGGASGGSAAATGGQGLYQQDCASCHGESGTGGMKVGGAVSSDLRAPGLEKMYHDNDTLLARAILTGVDAKGQTLDPAMPRWRGSLNSKQVQSIIDYLKSLHG